MLDRHLKTSLLNTFKYTPTANQMDAISALAQFIAFPSAREVLLLNGYAGTGKTSLMSAFVSVVSDFNINVVLLAPTGRAAKVLSSYCGKPAFTIHKHIYRQKGGGDAFANFDVGFNRAKETIYIVDEASMISNQASEAQSFGSGRLLDDLIEYVFSGTRCALILLGDMAQLPPVGTPISPALDRTFLEGYGVEVKEVHLTQVVRQEMESGILYNATELRNQIEDGVVDYPDLVTEGFDDFKRIGGADLIESLVDSYDKVGVEETLVITRSNKVANRYNLGIRNSVLYREEMITPGDLVMVVKNNYLYGEKETDLGFIANGDIAEVGRLSGYIDLYNYKYADAWLTFNGAKPVELQAKVLLDTLTVDGPSLSYNDQRALYDVILEDYPELKSKKDKAKYMRTDAFFNALQLKFAYAVTCHKSQGGQWKHIYIDMGYFVEDMLDVEFYRWLYTAITRATEKVYLVNFKNDFFKK